MIHPVSFADNNLMRMHPVNITFPWLPQRSRMNMCGPVIQHGAALSHSRARISCCLDKKYTMVSAYRPTKQVKR